MIVLDLFHQNLQKTFMSALDSGLQIQKFDSWRSASEICKILKTYLRKGLSIFSFELTSKSYRRLLYERGNLIPITLYFRWRHIFSYAYILIRVFVANPVGQMIYVYSLFQALLSTFPTSMLVKSLKILKSTKSVRCLRK